MQALSIAAGGMMNAMARFDGSARRVAGGSLDNLANEAVEQAKSKTELQANAAVVRTAAEMQGTLLDILA